MCVVQVAGDIRAHDVFGLDAQLHVIAGLQLAISHVVVLHAHERRVVVCLGIAVALAEYLLVRLILSRFLLHCFQLLDLFLKRAPALSLAVDEFDALLFCYFTKALEYLLRLL